MPQMGESIAEGTIVRWIKKVGDAVDRDEPLFEISTDKVDAEIPSPAAGVLTEIRVKEGETVPVNSVVAVIGAAGDVACGRRAGWRECRRIAGSRGRAAGDRADVRAALRRRLRPRRRAPSAAAQPGGSTSGGARGGRSRRRSSAGSRRSTTSTSRRINGTGISGRVTKHDILAFIESGEAAPRRARRPARPLRRRAPAVQRRRATSRSCR